MSGGQADGVGEGPDAGDLGLHDVTAQIRLLYGRIVLKRGCCSRETQVPGCENVIVHAPFFFAKLGVETRTAAAARALALLSSAPADTKPV